MNVLDGWVCLLYLRRFHQMSSFLRTLHWTMVDLQCCVTFCYIAKQISFTRASICCFLDSQCFFQAFFLSSILKVRPLGVAHLKQRLKTYDGCKPGNGSFLAVTPDNLGWIPALCRDCVTSYHRRSYSPVLVSSPSVINDRGRKS